MCTCGVSVRCVLTFRIRLPSSRRGQVALGVNKEEDRIRNRGDWKGFTSDMTPKNDTAKEGADVESHAIQWSTYDSRVLPSFENFKSSSVGLAILVLLISSGMPDSSNTWKVRQRAHHRLQSSVQ